MAADILIHPVDRFVGARLRKLRATASLRPEALSERLRITPRQLERYELGLDRIGASTLFELSDALGVPIATFFEGLGGAFPETGSRGAGPAGSDFG